MFHVDRQTDMTKLIVVFRNFANALKILHNQVIFVSSRGMLGVQCGTGIDFSPCTLNFLLSKIITQMLYNHMLSRAGTTGPLVTSLSKNSVSPHPRNKKESSSIEDCCHYIACSCVGFEFFPFLKLWCCHCLVVPFDTGSTGDTKYCRSERRSYIEY